MADRILVTGGLGYLGSIVCEHLLGAGYEVTALDNLMYGPEQQGLFHLCASPAFDFIKVGTNVFGFHVTAWHSFATDNEVRRTARNALWLIRRSDSGCH